MKKYLKNILQYRLGILISLLSTTGFGLLSLLLHSFPASGTFLYDFTIPFTIILIFVSSTLFLLGIVFLFGGEEAFT